MKLMASSLALMMMATASTATVAQFVKGNEAVMLLPGGTRRVDLAPLPPSGPIRSTKPCAAADKCYGGAWLMVETSDGLVECTEAYARPGTCRASTYGTTKLLRLWVVKAGDTWLQCQLPSLTSRCVPLFARPPGNLPFPAVQ